MKIEIRKSEKLDDEYSAFISFKYDKRIVDIMRGLAKRYYIPETKEWEVPVDKIPQIKKDLSFVPSILVTGHTEELKSRTSKAKLPKGFEFKTEPFQHQMEAILYGMSHDKWFLGDEMGLGKTKTAIDIAVARKVRDGYKHCLIVCGVNTLKWNWRNEIYAHSNEECWILGQRILKNGTLKIGSTKDKITDLENLGENDNAPYFIITNVESFRTEEIANIIKRLCDDGIIEMCVLDEAHKCKNPTSAQTKGFLKCQPKCRIAMTGTPLMNNPLDLYMILKWLECETHSFWAFKKYYCVMGGYGGYEVVGYKNMPQLNSQLKDIMVRRKKDEVFDLPEKTYVEEYVDMLPKQSIIYNEVDAEIRSNIDMIDLSNNPLASLIRLRQATGYPGILSSTVHDSAKLDRLDDLVDETIANDKKCIVFSNWTQITDEIQNRLKRHSPVVITGDTKDQDRQPIVDKFQTDKDCKVIIGTIGALGTGVTLTAATVVIFVDEPWSKALFEQAVDRAHRVGTTDNVTIYSIMCKNTIDERIHDIIYKKGLMSDALIDGSGMTAKQVFMYLLG